MKVENNSESRTDKPGDLSREADNPQDQPPQWCANAIGQFCVSDIGEIMWARQDNVIR